MKKSFRPSKVNRPISRPSISRPKGAGEHGSSFNKSFQQPKKGGLSSKDSFAGAPGGFKQGSSFLPGQKRARSNRSIPLIVLLVLFVCCVVGLCIAGVYLYSQGQISIPSFG
jgi:hypothetical protein